MKDFEFIVSDSVPEGDVFLIPKIPGLTLVDGALKVAAQTGYRDLTDDEKRQFGRIKNASSVANLSPTINKLA